MARPERCSGALAAAVALLPLAGPAWADAQTAPAQTQASAAADAALRGQVLHRLARDPDAGLLKIAVDVRDGVAVLRGSVPHMSARDKAVLAAAQVPGLLDVRSEIGIEAVPGGDEALRAALAGALREALRWFVVESDVDRGVATLGGRVRTAQERAAARNCALRLPGLQGLRNQLVVDSEAGLDDARLRVRLVELIENRTSYPIEGEITVQVRDGEVTLGGEVPRVYDRLVAEKVVDIVSVVRSVRNNIRVVPGSGRRLIQSFPVQPR